MKKLIVITFVFVTFSGYSQIDSLTVFFIGRVPNERFKVYWNGIKALEFKSTNSYKYTFKIPRDDSWIRKGNIEQLTIYRKGKLSLVYRDVGFYAGYEDKLYLIINRNPRLRKKLAVDPSWSNDEPKQPPAIH